MIQRIQSILLLIIGVLLVATPFFTNWKKEKGTLIVKQNGIAIELVDTENPEPQVLKTESRIYLMATSFLAAGLSFFSLFSYKKRKIQMLIGSLNSLVMVALVAMILYSGKAPQDWLTNGEHKYQIGLFLPMIAIMMNIISNRFIRRDERLVQSMDRVR